MATWPTKKKLAKIRREIDSHRRAIPGTTSRDLRRIAKQLGRVLDAGRGKEPTYVSTLIDANPISIPHDAKGDGTKRNILDDLEGDLVRLEVDNERGAAYENEDDN
ncbi:MAG: hypothetical protein ACRD3J_02960 [Thermoanaerobaculia bacterium]